MRTTTLSPPSSRYQMRIRIAPTASVHQTVELSTTTHGMRNVVLGANVTLGMQVQIAHFVNVHQKTILLADRDDPKGACALDVELVTIPLVVALASVAITGNVAKAKPFYFKLVGASSSSWRTKLGSILFERVYLSVRAVKYTLGTKPLIHSNVL